MSHVEVPPLRRPKSAYQLYEEKRPIHREKKPKPPVQTHFQVRNSLQVALQAAYSHNGDLGTPPSHLKIVSKNKKPKERRGENFNAAAGPSTLHPPSTVNPTKKRGRPRKDDSDCEDGRKGEKRSRILVDMTLSGDEQVHRKVKSAPTARARYKPQTDTLLLYLGLIHRVPLSVLTYNTRFLCNFRAKSYGISPPNDATTDGTSAHRYFIPPKLSVQLHEADDITLIRGPLTWEEDFNLPVEDDSDGEVAQSPATTSTTASED